MTKKIRIGLVFGGKSGEHEVSLASAASIMQALDKSRYEIYLIGIDKAGRWLQVSESELLNAKEDARKLQLSAIKGNLSINPLAKENPQIVSVNSNPTTHLPKLDLVFPVLHGTFGEDGTIQGLLELAQIPFVGSGVLGSAVGMDKDLASRVFNSAGIRTVPYVLVRHHDWAQHRQNLSSQIAKEIGFPCFVKPANAGSSVGVHKVKAAEQLPSAIADSLKFDTKVLVQKFIPARELEVSVLGSRPPQASIVGEIVPRHEFYSYEAKYLDENGAELKIPSDPLPLGVEKQAKEWATRAFTAIECRGLARVDFFLDRSTSELYLNEINTMPGFTKISMYPKLWEASGLAYPDLLNRLIEIALQDFSERQNLSFSYEPQLK